jgi:glycosyltransferase involved in cell wall biosynthesis
MRVSVVVPVLDEARRIGPLLDGLVGVQACDDVVVVDGGSADGTADLARAHGGATVV